MDKLSEGDRKRWKRIRVWLLVTLVAFSVLAVGTILMAVANGLTRESPHFLLLAYSGAVLAFGSMIPAVLSLAMCAWHVAFSERR